MLLPDDDVHVIDDHVTTLEPEENLAIAAQACKVSQSQSDGLRFSSAASAEQMVAQFTERALAGVQCTYFKERTNERMPALYCMDRDLRYLIILSGERLDAQEVLCPMADVEELYGLDGKDAAAIPQVLRDMAQPQERENLFMIVFRRQDRRKIRFCILEESPDARKSATQSLSILSVYKRKLKVEPPALAKVLELTDTSTIIEQEQQPAIPLPVQEAQAPPPAETPAPEAPAPVAQAEVCSCGIAFKAGAKFCHKCGKARNEVAVPAPPPKEQEPPKPEPLPPPRIWTIILDNSVPRPLGVDLAKRGFVVSQVLGAGLIVDWNQANPHAAVQKGDRLLEVNGQTAPAKVVAECTFPQNLNCKFQRKVATWDAFNAFNPEPAPTPAPKPLDEI